MNRAKHLMAGLAIAWVASGCESIALLPRQDISRVDRSDRSGVDRDRDQRGVDRGVAREEVVGTVQQVDERRNEIHLRTTDGRMTIVKYDPRTVVYHRDKELRVDDLRYGDLVLIQLGQDARGDRYADSIRMNDREEKEALRY